MSFRQPSTYLLLAVAGLAVFGLWSLQRDDCDQRCTVAVEEALRLGAEEGGAEDGLVLLDAVDATCTCARGYEGDRPPADSAVQTLLQKLSQEEGGREAAQRLLKEAKGPLLKGASSSSSAAGR